MIKMIGVMSLLLIAMWVLLFFGIQSESDVFIFLASCGLILLSIYVMVNGLEDVNNFVTRGFALVQLSVALIGIYAPLYGALNERQN